MDSSYQSASSTSDELSASLPSQQEADIQEAEPHIHLPNPSYWPLLLSIAIGLTMVGVLFVSIAPWILPITLILVLIAIMGWALEDPMAPLKEEFVTIYQRVVEAGQGKFRIGQNVVDSQGKWLGKIQARFSRYILVERGHFLPTVYYVPRSATKEQIKNNTVFLTLSEDDLVRQGLNSVPNDLYDEVPEAEFPRVKGIAQFARRPLSPAETGHYNYGKNSPGINTDASGSYLRQEVLPNPRDYVTEGVHSTDWPIPPRVISPD